MQQGQSCVPSRVLAICGDCAGARCRLPGHVVEALDEPPALWIAGELRREPTIVGALADDWPFMALLRVDDALVRVGQRSQAPAAADPSLRARTEPRP